MWDLRTADSRAHGNTDVVYKTEMFLIFSKCPLFIQGSCTCQEKQTVEVSSTRKECSFHDTGEAESWRKAEMLKAGEVVVQ